MRKVLGCLIMLIGIGLTGYVGCALLPRLQAPMLEYSQSESCMLWGATFAPMVIATILSILVSSEGSDEVATNLWGCFVVTPLTLAGVAAIGYLFYLVNFVWNEPDGILFLATASVACILMLVCLFGGFSWIQKPRSRSRNVRVHEYIPSQSSPSWSSSSHLSSDGDSSSSDRDDDRWPQTLHDKYLWDQAMEKRERDADVVPGIIRSWFGIEDDDDG